MAETRSTIDTERLEKLLRTIPKQIPFATARTLTALAKDGQEAARVRIEAVVDNPTPFTKRAVAIQPAKKQTLVATVFIKDVQAGYLAGLETGGVEIARSGNVIVPPVDIRTNKYGNVPRGAVRRELAKDRTFRVTSSSAKTRHLPPGVYQRKSKRRGGLKMLVSFEPKAAYKPILGFGDAVRTAVRKNVERRWRESLIRTLETMRLR